MATTGRFDCTTFRGRICIHIYHKPIYLDALDEWHDIAQLAGRSKADLAYRWVGYHFLLRGECSNAVLFATSSPEQLRMTTKGF